MGTDNCRNEHPRSERSGFASQNRFAAFQNPGSSSGVGNSSKLLSMMSNVEQFLSMLVLLSVSFLFAMQTSNVLVAAQSAIDSLWLQHAAYSCHSATAK